MSDEDNPAFVALLEDTGEEQVRLRVAAGDYAAASKATVLRWLKKKDQESRARRDAANSLSERIATETLNAAKIAAIAAIIAVAVAIISTVIALIAWLFPLQK